MSAICGQPLETILSANCGAHHEAARTLTGAGLRLRHTCPQPRTTLITSATSVCRAPGAVRVGLWGGAQHVEGHIVPPKLKHVSADGLRELVRHG